MRVRLSQEQRAELQRLLEEELRAAWRAAAADGVPAEALAADFDERLRRIVELSAETSDELPSGRDHPGDDDGIREQR